MQKNIDAWCDFHPGYAVHVWNLHELHELSTEFSQLKMWECIEASRFPAMKADIARLAILYKYGGIYSDLKNLPHRAFLDELVQFAGPILVEHALIATPTWPRLSNSFFCAPQGHQFFLDCLVQACVHVTNRTPATVLDATGPGLIKRIYGRWAKAGKRDEIKVFSPDVVWAQEGVKSQWMMRTLAAYNGKNNVDHWSKREKIVGIYNDKVE